MSFREKRAWVTLICTLLVFGFYFVVMSERYLSSAFHPGDGVTAHLFITCLSIVILVEIGVNVLAVVLIPKVRRIPIDERERLIEYKATKFGYYALCIGTFLAMFIVVHAPDRFIGGHFVMLTLFVAIIAKAAVQVVYFRRGA